ncbi:MAG: tetratricopeptide repeat protein [Mesorhizobium sp.]|nr:MAG: tetratricopeptide repeat protein [Mesorhizobium sp.]
MLKTFRFNPGFQTDDQAVANFIVRQREFREVLDALSSSEGGHHRVLIVAPRGAGKTTLLRRVLAEVRTDLFMREMWLPIVLGEESYAATTPGEFLLECLYHLAQEGDYRALQAKHRRASEIEDEIELRRFCIKTLEGVSSKAKKRLLIMVENFHILLRDQIGKNADDLVDLLRDESLFGVLATSVKTTRESDSDKFGASCKNVSLKPLTLPECQRLWEALTNREVDQSRIRPLQILTGGSPRLLHILADFMKTPSLHDLMENLSFLIDENTEYFKSQLDALPSQERKVFVALLEAWDPSSAKQIASIARVTINNASAMLNRLADRGAVIKQPGGGRLVLYNAAERLFNIYYLMRRRSHPSNRVRALVAFMTQYYDRQELVDTTTLLAQEACAVAPGSRSDYHNAYNAILRDQPESIRTEILKRTPADFLHSLRNDSDVENQDSRQKERSADSEFEEMLSRGRTLLSNGDSEEGKALLWSATRLQPKDYRPWISLAFAEMAEGQQEAAIENARKAVALADRNPVPHVVLATLFRSVDRNDDAKREIRAALDIDSDMSLALVELAEMKHDDGELVEARHLFTRAAAQGPLSGTAASRYAFILSRDGETALAETVLRTALREDDSDDPARHALVHLLLENGRGDEAADLLRAAAERGNDEDAWLSYGSFLLSDLDQPKRAVNALETAITRGVSGGSIFNLLARATQKAGGSPAEISAIADRLSVKQDRSEETLVAEGRIRQRAGDTDGAEFAFSSAASLPKASGYPSILLGRLLSGVAGRSAEAATAFERAVQLDGVDHCGPIKELAELRVHQGNDAEATALLDRALAINPSCECSLVLQAEIHSRTGDRKTARQICQRALEMNSVNVAALTTLARISEDDDAADLIERAIAVDPNDPQALLARSRLKSRSLSERIADAESALVGDSRLTEAHIELAALYGASGDKAEFIAHFNVALETISTRMEVVPALVVCTIKLIKRGYLPDVLKALTSDRAKPVEPLSVAVQKFSGIKPVVAKEIEEVADDILKRITAAAKTIPSEPDLLTLSS